jgi:uncharacterized protein (DUF885 family)
MVPISHALALGLVFLGLAACSAPPTPAPPESAAPAVPHEQLNRMVDRYWDERAPGAEPISPQQMADSLAIERRYLAEVLAVPRAGLNAESRLTYDIFKRQRELEIEGFTFPTELLPVNPFDGPWLQLARSAAQTAQHPLRGAQDCENWLRQIDDVVTWSRQAIANMRAGMRRGYTSPRSLMQRTLPLLEQLGEDGPANVFYLPVRTLPQTLQASERTRLTQSLAGAVKDKLLPAYRGLHDFIQSEYLPRARTSLALSVLPLGPSWYAFLVKRATDSALAPAEIHALGLAEVDRLQARLSSLPPGVAPAGAAPTGAAPKDAGELLAGYRLLETQILAAMPGLFAAAPPTDFEVRAADPFILATTPLVYRPAAPGAGPAVLYVNAAPNGGRRAAVDSTSFMQEAIPGRHYQSSLQQARADLPKFRRFGTDPAFVDGWALYAASLGEELGVAREDDARRSVLLSQLKCAAALVVDTGLHAMDWTREQAVDYLRAQLATDAADANLMIDRFVALPGDALACKMGELKIRALRNRAQTVLGTRFDTLEFHSQILKDGAMPLDILEAKIKLWMEP